MKQYLAFFWALLALTITMPAAATEASFQPVSGGIMITLHGVDAPDGPPPEGALHCLTGTRHNWASQDGGRTFAIGRMIGGCTYPSTRGTVTHTVSWSAVNSRGVLCLIPVWVTTRGRFLAWSSHPDGPTQQTARKGGMITALVPLSGGNWRPATPDEAYTCD